MEPVPVRPMVLTASSEKAKIALFPIGAASVFEEEDWLTDTVLRTAAGMTALGACLGDRSAGGKGVRFRFLPYHELPPHQLAVIAEPGLTGVSGRILTRIRRGIQKGVA